MFSFMANIISFTITKVINGTNEEFYYVYGLHCFQEGAVCLQHISLDKEKVPETDQVLIMMKKDNDHK